MLFPINAGKEIWNESEVRFKLKDLANADKSKQWIQADLSTPDSSAIGRFFWTVVGKHFQCTRTAFYNVNIRTSKRILEELRETIPTNSDLINLFDRAAANFERITHRRLGLPQKIFTQMVDRLPIIESQPEVVFQTVSPIPIASPPIVVIETPVRQPPVIFRESTVSSDNLSTA